MLYYMGIPHFAYPGSSGWTLRLLSYFSYSDYYCSKHWSTNISLRPWFQFLWVYLIGKFLDHVVILFFNIWKIAILFCKAAVSFYIPTASPDGTPFLRHWLPCILSPAWSNSVFTLFFGWYFLYQGCIISSNSSHSLTLLFSPSPLAYKHHPSTPHSRTHLLHGNFMFWALSSSPI